jgi:hypothetical protein
MSNFFSKIIAIFTPGSGSAFNMRDPEPATDPQAYFIRIPAKMCFYTSSYNQCCGTVTIYYGSGSGSDF